MELSQQVLCNLGGQLALDVDCIDVYGGQSLLNLVRMCRKAVYVTEPVSPVMMADMTGQQGQRYPVK